MKRLLVILSLLTVFCINAQAQQDTSRRNGYLPLYDNLQSDSDNTTDPTSQKYSDDKESPTGEALRALQRYYNAGKYPEALRQSQQIRENHHLNSSENERYLRYTIASYKEMAYDEEADSVMKIFTKKYPFYELNSDDPVSFQEVFNNFKTIPRWAIFFDIQWTRTGVDIDSIFPRADTTKIVPDYDDGRCFNLEIGMQYGFNEKWSLAMSLKTMTLDYTRVEDQGATKFYYEETDTYLSLPILVFYKRPFRFLNIQWIPEFGLGVSADFLGGAEYQAYSWFGSNTSYTVSDKTIDLIEKNQLNFSVLSSIRISVALKNRWSFFIERQWQDLLLPQNNEKYRYHNSDLVFNQLYVPDAITLSTKHFKIGLRYNLRYKTMAKYHYGY